MEEKTPMRGLIEVIERLKSSCKNETLADVMDDLQKLIRIYEQEEIEYGKQQYNKAVFDCVENAEITSVQRYAYGNVHYFVDKNSMLKLLKQ